MKAYDFDAVAYDGATYCVDCCPVPIEDEEVSPIFADEERDSSVTCDVCGMEHDYMTILEQEEEEQQEEDLRTEPEPAEEDLDRYRQRGHCRR
ncbi:MAG: hypothetical protein KJ604_20685 [Gammaproteobacteria bacterium]|nr:hypothetical protein [Gammaproteobacteria bacterium]